jgi:adenosylcobyric acid synthase
MVRGFIVNKFRGDPALFAAGRAEIVRRTGWPDLGMVPWLAPAALLPAEDAVVLDHVTDGTAGVVKIAVPMLSRIANFDDFDPLKAEPAVELLFVPPGRPLPGDAALVILPGTKATLGDLAFFRAQGWDVDLAAHVRRGGRVLGICGGLQMLGRSVADPDGIEGRPGEAPGLGLLALDTVLAGEKVLKPVQGLLAGARVEGYEMHMGLSTGPALARPFLEIDGRGEGAVSMDGRIAGTYVHGLFASGAARAKFLSAFAVAAEGGDYGGIVDRALDDIAAVLAQSLDIVVLSGLAGIT